MSRRENSIAAGHTIVRNSQPPGSLTNVLVGKGVSFGALPVKIRGSEDLFQGHPHQALTSS